MRVHGVTPILNVSDLAETFVWFERLGWSKAWDWGDPPSFGAVRNGRSEIFLCEGCQGSRGGPRPRHVGDDDTGGVWMTWWVRDPAAVDAAYEAARAQGVTVLQPPEDKPWNVRECHIAHPDGHTFRVTAGLGEEG